MEVTALIFFYGLVVTSVAILNYGGSFKGAVAYREYLFFKPS